MSIPGTECSGGGVLEKEESPPLVLWLGHAGVRGDLSEGGQDAEAEMACIPLRVTQATLPGHPMAMLPSAG